MAEFGERVLEGEAWSVGQSSTPIEYTHVSPKQSGGVMWPVLGTVKVRRAGLFFTLLTSV